MKKLNNRQEEILEIISKKAPISISEIQATISIDTTIVTLNRDLSKLVANQKIQKIGGGRATQYILNPISNLLQTINPDAYFETEIEKRNGATQYNFSLLETLIKTNLFSSDELKQLNSLKKKYQENLKKSTPSIYKKEMERLMIELSWKSSQIEGNTYSLLETELLLQQQIEAKNKKKEEAIMLLNHKLAIEYINNHPKDFLPLKLSVIEDLHNLLTQKMNVSRNLRKIAVGITGSSYKPLDNAFQIREQLEEMCKIINEKENAFEKALLAILFISYLQPFEDGNKRTARITTNAILINSDNCPLSYRSIDPGDYKKAILLFYEQNNITAFKKIFIEQYAFAVNNYFVS